MRFNYFRYNHLNLPEITHPGKTRHFNTSLVELSPGIYLFAVRYISYLGSDSLIPGNSSRCRNTKSIGNHYWWNNWGISTKEFVDSTDFLIGPLNGPLETINYNYIWAHRYNKLTLEEQGSDIRLMRSSDGVIYAYSSQPRYIYRVEYVSDLRILQFRQLRINIRPVLPEGYKNVSIIDIVEYDKTISVTCFDWFYQYGARIFRIIINTNTSKDPDKYIGVTYQSFYDHSAYTLNFKYPILGIGSYVGSDTNISSPLFEGEEIKEINTDQLPANVGYNYGKMPAFSLSTPTILLSNGWYLGVGHLKIHSDEEDYPYTGNIQKFRSELYHYMEEKYGYRYIYHYGTGSGHSDRKCSGYIYMIYFYLIDKQSLDIATVNPDILESPFEYREKTKDSVIKISDGYLPMTEMDSLEPYRFTLVFPMGLIVDNETVIVSAGVGDYYSVLLEFDLPSVIKTCVHDSKCINMDNYNYYLLESHATTKLY